MGSIPTTCRAAVIVEYGTPLEIREIEIPTIGPGAILVKVLMAGICGTDVHQQKGELTIKSPCLMKGYHYRPRDTEKTIRDGWLFTGDIAWMDDNGYFYVIDRRKDMIVSGAFKAYPAEVEAVLRMHPLIREVAVVGLFDDFWGHSLKAFVVPEKGAGLTEDEVKRFAVENLSEHKVPRAVEFREELPKNEMGKILRRELEQ